MTLTEGASRYMTARGYVEAAKMIYLSSHRDSEDKRAMTILPMNMLIGFALELHFKAWLLGCGKPSPLVRSYGHRVHDLLKACKEEGFPEIKLLDQLVDALGDQHEDYTFRYINSGDEICIVSWDKAFPVLDKVDAAVEQQVAARAWAESQAP